MSNASFPEYSRAVIEVLNGTVGLGLAQLSHLEIDQKSSLRGYVHAVLRFQDASELHVREFYDATQSEARVMYAYHCQDGQTNLRFRYDNAAHRPPVGQREHKHTTTGVVPAPIPSLQDVIDEALDYL